MNKRKLTKTFSFSKWLLFFFFAVGVTLSSCGEDYDDDISNLQEQINKMGNYTELQAKIDGLQTALDQTKQIAEDAKTAADKAGDATAADVEKAKLEAIAEANAELAKVKAELEAEISKVPGTGITQAEMDEIVKKVTESLNPVEAKILNLVGHRVTSLVRIPTQTLNDEPAIIFRNLTYVPQSFNPLHEAYTDKVNGVLMDHQGDGEVTLNAGARLFIDNQSTAVKYQVSPAISVKKADIEAPFYMGSIQENLNMRSVSPEFAGKDSPIKVASWDLDEKTGVLTVNVTKSVPASQNINFEGQGTDYQKYYIASLHTIIPEADRTVEEKENGVIPEVASEYSRLAEITVTPMIKQVGTDETINHHDIVMEPVDRAELLNGKNEAGKYVHYHDSTSLYRSGDLELIDHEIVWNEDVDLRKYVTVCEFEKLYIKPDGTELVSVGSHADIEDYAAYGLEFRFAVPTTPYLYGTNNTDQQQFAEVKGSYILNSRVYGLDGKSRTAIGRQPIVRVQLIDTRNNNNLVAQRYIKFIWVQGTVDKDITVKFPQDTVTCKMHTNTVFTKEMNEDFYAQLQSFGYTKDEFHATYKATEITSLLKDGEEILFNPPLTWRTLDDTYNSNNGITVQQANDYAKNVTDDKQPTAEDVIFAVAKDQNQNGMSYNLKWYMSPKAVGTIKDFKKSDYVLTVKFKSSVSNEVLIAKFTQTIIVPPQNLSYVSTAWGTTAELFNINPSVYAYAVDYQLGTPNFPMGQWTGWNTGKYDYNHITSDLVDGFAIKGTNQNPTNLDQFIQYIRSCAEVRFEFDDTRFANYPHLAGFSVTNDRQALWSGMPVTLSDPQLTTYSHPDVRGGQYDYLAAVIDNKFGATILEAEKTTSPNLPWGYKETLGSGNDEASSRVWLSEINPSDGSTAANSLVGKKVPVSLVVEYNEYNKVPILNYEINIWKPLILSQVEVGHFTDLYNDGYPLNVEKGLNYTDYRGWYVSPYTQTPPASVTLEVEQRKWTHAQFNWDYYQVRDVVYDTDNARTNLHWVGNVYTPGEGITNGEMPTKRSVKQAIYNSVTGQYSVVSSNPTHLLYFNNLGTPVNEDYLIFMNVSAVYKWGEVKTNVTIPVKGVSYVDPTIVP